MSKTVLVAMSGGVDSSVAALLMKQQGFMCLGATMSLFDNDGSDNEDARNVADLLGIPHHTIDLADDFKERVIDRFADVYLSGGTPNPCVDCNRHIKFGKLLESARKLGADYIATGHYARVCYDASNNRYMLKKAADVAKDQSYVLYSLTQSQLKHVLFPLGELSKDDIRKIASAQGFINADKRDSQDICFIRDGDYAGFIEQYTAKHSDNPAAGITPGDFIDKQGNVLGRHRGLIRYTIGQRKGLGLSLKNPMYVCSKDIKNNTVTLCVSDELFVDALEAADFNWILHGSMYPECDLPIRVKARIRYNSLEQPATAMQRSDGTVHIVFDKPQRAVTPGQAVVLYDGDTVLGGGTIE